MTPLGYAVTLIPHVTDPLRVTALDGDGRDVPVRGATLLDAADAVLHDATARRWPIGDVMAFSAIAFRGLGEGGALAITVRSSVVERFVDAARRVA